MATVRATVRYNAAVEDPVVGLLIRTQVGFEVFGTNTELDGSSWARAPLETASPWCSDSCATFARTYTLTLASHDPDGTVHDWLDDAIAVTVTDERPTAGVANSGRRSA